MMRLSKAKWRTNGEQDGAVHLFARRELREALRNCLGGYDYADFGMIVWHARGMPEDGCSTVTGGRGPSRVRNGWKAVLRRAAISAYLHHIGGHNPVDHRL
jgi:hypothetical protein